MLGNKNTVTILGVLVGIAVILIGYNYRVNNAVKPVEVPYAKVNYELPDHINDSDITSIEYHKVFEKSIVKWHFQIGVCRGV